MKDHKESIILYKYRPPINFKEVEGCYTAKIFADSQLYFAQHSSFNDPFEGIISLDVTQSKEEAIDRHFRVIRKRMRESSNRNPISATWYNAKDNVDKIYEQVIAEKFIDHKRYYKDVMDQYGVLSLCRNSTNLLLWSHYASNHNGICLGFQWGKTKLPDAQEVIYQTNFRKLDFWFYTEDEIAQIALLQKSVDWSYEQEHRSIFNPTYEDFQEYQQSTSSNEDKINPLIKSKYNYQRVISSGFGAKNFAKESLQEVIFGMRMSQENIYKHIKYINSQGFSPLFRQAKQSSVRYEIEI